MAQNLQKLASYRGDAGGLMTTSDEFREAIYRNADRDHRRFLRSEWFGSHSLSRRRPFALDVPVAEPSDGKDTPELPKDLKLSGFRKLAGALLDNKNIPLSWGRTCWGGRGGRCM